MIVDDSLIVRTVLSRIIEEADGFEIIAKSSSAELAIAELAHKRVDVILLDLEMPGMGGLDALPMILAAARGAQVLVVSSLTEEGAEHTIAALRMGAADTMLKPRSGGFDQAYRTALLEKIHALAPTGPESADVAEAALRGTESIAPGTGLPPLRKAAPKPPRVIAVGASTGGIHALCILLRNLPQQLELPILVTQHLPESFIPVFARQLESAGGRKTVVAGSRTPIEPGCIHIAPGNGHMMVRESGGRLITEIGHFPVTSGCRPSVDPMLETLADATGGHALGIVLSGMGRDGVEGAAKLVQAGGTILAQDESSSAVWGMPRAVAEAGLTSAILPPADLASRIGLIAGATAWK
ncbi:chemotaxis-specific protein-glutamate methyltransferase CheB [Allopontixanthobacter sp.]|uniref:chemotaxis-specific protein-glutamate methyltransferase CheB n=1 Tax=Allopontixanthobacter sp. TaxID=2906452 RepID=UPI002AB842DE|nr:chemotaxis-specific protein-glutamate methyltransferase CheB [Allopontixanthobacter sp.]MDZ4306494.1 chemotaxis-specific protein-glutamate methyltransferase CheB [Allopontixanthobacter sp.]